MVEGTLQQDLAPTFVSTGIPTVPDVFAVFVATVCVVVENRNFSVAEVVDTTLARVAAVAVFAVTELDVL
jgi:hypothetical protein